MLYDPISVKTTQSRHICRDRKNMSDCQGLGGSERWPVGTELSMWGEGNDLLLDDGAGYPAL